MTEAAIQQEYVSTLKTLNNTIVTIRTFPANAPQVNNAVERGYRILKEHLRRWGDFSLAIVGDDLMLCGGILSEETIRSISNLILYRQLELLESPHCTVQPGLERKVFKKLLEVFSAKVDQIRQEGGGRSFVRKLGVEEYFFNHESVAEVDQARTEVPEVVEKAMPVRQVPKELVDVLLGRESRRSIVDELICILAESEKGGHIFVAALSGILEGLKQNKVFANSAALNQIFGNYEKLAADERHQEFMRVAADLALQDLEFPLLALLMSQKFTTESGKLFSELLLRRISIEQFAGVVRELRKTSSRFRLTGGGDSRQLQFLNNAVKMLLATSKGKQYLGKEKAQSILDAGEKARKAQRIQAAIRALMQGNIEVFGSEEFIGNLPSVLRKMSVDGMGSELGDILDKFSGYFSEAAADGQAKLIKSLVQVAEDCITGGFWDQFKRIAEPLLLWIRESDSPDGSYERACICLQEFMGYSWRQGEWRDGDRVLSMLYRIRSGNLKKNDKVREIVGRVQDRRIDRDLLAHLLTACLDNPRDEVVSRRLVLQGPVATRFLVDRLMQADSAQNRFKIIDLLTYGEQFLPAIIIEKLAEPMPWYGKRNLLKLLAETGRKEHLEVAFPFLQHEDMRVQREAFNCLYKISGDERKSMLLRGLADAGEAMKLQIMLALAPMSDNEVTRKLEQVLADYQYYSEEFRDTLLIQACRGLARCPLPEPERVLEEFLEQRGARQTKRIGNRVWDAATEALEQLGETQRGAVRVKVKPGQLRAGGRRQMEAAGGAEPRLKTGLEEERRIYELLDIGQKAPAREMLLNLIGKMARQRRFNQAESLREWLIQLDPLALKDIIRAAEIIENEKQIAGDPLQQDIWVELSDSLNTAEFSALYHALDKKRYGNEEILVQKGSEQGALYFINSGKVKLYYRIKDRDILFKVMEPGEILGAHVIFNASTWTFSASALGQTSIAILKVEQLQQWKENFPELESKLKHFCERFEDTGKFFESGTNDRRRHVRIPLEPAAVTMTLMNEVERSFGVELRGKLLDFSQGGISLVMRITRKDNARLMLGRSIQLFLPYGMSGEKTITFHGQIVAVREKNVMKMEYSIHIQFFKELREEQVEQVARLVALRKLPDAMSGS